MVLLGFHHFPLMRSAFSLSIALTHACLPFVMVSLKGGAKVDLCRACRVKRMTCRFKSDRGSSAVRPRSLREV